MGRRRTRRKPIHGARWRHPWRQRSCAGPSYPARRLPAPRCGRQGRAKAQSLRRGDVLPPARETVWRRWGTLARTVRRMDAPIEPHGWVYGVSWPGCPTAAQRYPSRRQRIIPPTHFIPAPAGPSVSGWQTARTPASRPGRSPGSPSAAASAAASTPRLEQRRERDRIGQAHLAGEQPAADLQAILGQHVAEEGMHRHQPAQVHRILGERQAAAGRHPRNTRCAEAKLSSGFCPASQK